MRLETLEFPAEAGNDAAPLIVAHGLFGAARNWRGLAKRMSGGRRTLVVDMRNHGASPHDPAHDYPAMAGDLAELIEASGGQAAVLGHSMGGKAAMMLAQTRPELVERLVVADIAPVTYEHTLSHHIAAMRGIDLGGLTRRSEVEAAIAAKIPEPGVAGFLAQSADLTASPPRWTLNLDALDDQMDMIVGYPAEDRVYDGEALFLHGGASDYVQPSAHDRIMALFPKARFEVLARAGHWLHAEKPREFISAVSGFLSE